MSLSYPDALAYLFPRVTQIKFGLDATRTLLAELGNPHTVYPTIHIGGTNGKGSVTALVAGALRVSGWRVGMYTSPHLVSFRERVQVDGVPIGEAAVAMWVERLRPVADRLGATFFETTTALAFADLAARGAEIAVIEVGLGGRLDSTNVVRPLVSAVTKIEMDHQKYLGETLAEIAREKAGIAKPGVPFVVGETRPEIVAVLEAEADRADGADKAEVRVVPPGWLYDGPLALRGAHQRRNAAIAEAVLEALPSRYRPGRAAIREAFGSVTLPGRLDRRGKWLFDVAHNPDGMAALCAAVEEGDVAPKRPIHALVSILGDKAWPEMLVRLDRVVDRGILTVAPSAEGGRRWDPDWLRQWLRDPHRPPAHATWQLIPDFREALGRVQEGAATVLVTGSFHTVGDVMEATGLGPV
ncbi:MAG TPA: Mur ligase family protein [Gemmatimonadales bacterium]|nr:Mur ligase family protein [Gemmatimonadales bacterium]